MNNHKKNAALWILDVLSIFFIATHCIEKDKTSWPYGKPNFEIWHFFVYANMSMEFDWWVEKKYGDNYAHMLSIAFRFCGPDQSKPSLNQYCLRAFFRLSSPAFARHKSLLFLWTCWYYYFSLNSRYSWGKECWNYRKRDSVTSNVPSFLPSFFPRFFLPSFLPFLFYYIYFTLW